MSRYLLNTPGGPLAGAVLGFAHRGGRLNENTLAAFRAAVAHGFAYLETDVRLSADGVLYAFHDAAVDRVTAGTGAVADLSSAELDALTVRGPAAEPPARFETLLRALPHARWNVDVKADGAAEELARLVASAGAEDRVLVSSFSSARRRRTQELLPGLVGSAGPWLVAASVLLGPLAVPLLKRARARGIVALQVPVRHYGLPVVRRAWLRRVHSAGLQAHVWVVDDARQMRELIDLGVDGIMTDEPARLASVLDALGQWPQVRVERGTARA